MTSEKSQAIGRAKRLLAASESREAEAFKAADKAQKAKPCDYIALDKAASEWSRCRRDTAQYRADLKDIIAFYEVNA